MSCSTLSTQAINLNVAMGNLPEGFCPNSLQEFGQAIAARLIITPSQNFNSFATGSVAPTSNVGPWFKDCQEWFFYDDATASYIPVVPRGTLSTQQYFTVSGNFIVPDFVYKIRAHAWGGGGGGAATSGGVYGAGGGAGGYGRAIFTVVPGQSIPLSIGSGGAGGGSPGGTGGNTTILTMTANGGTGGTTSGASSTGGAGGTVTGADFSINGQGGTSPTTGNVISGVGGLSGQGGGGGVLSPTQSQADGQVPGGGGAGEVTGSAPIGVPGSGAAGGILIEY